MNQTIIHNSWIDLKNVLFDHSAAVHIPLTGSFELTPRCNFHCKMCYVRLDENKMSQIGRELTAEDWINLGRQAVEAGTLILLLTGGEVFLRPDFKEIYEALNEMGLLIKIYTNGSLITEDMINWISKIPPIQIRITLYGASNETYARVCGDPHGFDKVVNAIDLIQKSNLPLALCSTLIEDNISDLDAMKSFAESRNLPFRSTVNVLGSVRGALSQAKSCRISEKQFQEMISHKVVEASFSEAADPMSRCRSSKCGFWVTWDGKMTLCSMMNEPYTFPLQSSFMDAWNELGELLTQIAPPPECVECKLKPFCQSCFGVFSSETGSCSKTSERICNQALAMYNAIHKQTSAE